MADVSRIKTHRLAASGVNDGQGRATGKTKGRLNSKRHLACDGAERPAHLPLAEIMRATCDRLSEVKASHIPRRKTRKAPLEYDADTCKTCNAVGRIFKRIRAVQ